MSEWKEYILENVIDKFIDYRGKTPKKTTYGIPLITAKIVKNERLLEANEFIAEEDYQSWMTRGFPEINDVVLTVEAPLGEVALIKNRNIALAQRIITLQTKKELCDSIFLKYYLQSHEGQGLLQARASGSTVEGIKSAELKRLEIYLPQLTEQAAIASILSSLDDKIDLLHRQNTTLEKMAKTLFKQWFVEEAKEEWVTCRLSDFISIKHGFAFKGNHISSEPTDHILVTPGNFKIGGGFKYDKFKYYNSNQFPTSYIFNSGDLIVTMTDLSVDGDTLGAPAIVPRAPKNHMYLHNQRVGKVEFKKDLCKYFLYFLMKTESYKMFIHGGATGTSIRHTSPTLICSFSFDLPPLIKLNEFNQTCSAIQDKISSNQIQIYTLSALRDTLLPKLMSGEVKVDLN